MSNCYEKLAVGPPAGVAKPTRETFHGFRVSRRDVQNCYEKFIAGMAPVGQRGLALEGCRVFDTRSWRRNASHPVIEPRPLFNKTSLEPNDT